MRRAGGGAARGRGGGGSGRRGRGGGGGRGAREARITSSRQPVTGVGRSGEGSTLAAARVAAPVQRAAPPARRTSSTPAPGSPDARRTAAMTSRRALCSGGRRRRRGLTGVEGADAGGCTGPAPGRGSPPHVVRAVGEELCRRGVGGVDIVGAGGGGNDFVQGITGAEVAPRFAREHRRAGRRGRRTAHQNAIGSYDGGARSTLEMVPCNACNRSPASDPICRIGSPNVTPCSFSFTARGLECLSAVVSYQTNAKSCAGSVHRTCARFRRR